MNKPLGRDNLPKRLIKMGRHLVYAEGTKTEPLYVESVKKELAKTYGILADQVEIHCFPARKSKHTLELVRFAEIDVQERLRKGETIHGVWIFFDRDCFDDFDKAYLRIVDKQRQGHVSPQGLAADENDISWVPCYSNECFELWVYLHFADLHAALGREDYIPKINEFLRAKNPKAEYAKNAEGLFQFLRDNGGDIKRAIRFAKRKVETLSLHAPRPNPSTGIYVFAEFFLAYIEAGESHLMR